VVGCCCVGGRRATVLRDFTPALDAAVLEPDLDPAFEAADVEATDFEARDLEADDFAAPAFAEAVP
jgi:hypothetical protein